MAAIKGKDTKPEMIVRKYLWSHGFRYRLNHKRLPGKPDLVLRKYRTCVFVNGCFWHGHNVICDEDALQKQNESDRILCSSSCCKIPKSNRLFWVQKILRNKERDIKVQQQLAAMGWHSIVVWECELTTRQREDTLASLAYTLNHILLQNYKKSSMLRKYDSQNEKCLMAAEEEAD